MESDVLPGAEEILLTRDRLQGKGQGSTDTDPVTAEKLRSTLSCNVVPPSLTSYERIKSRNVYQTLRPWQTRLIELLPNQDETGMPACRLLTVEFIDMEGVGIAGTNEIVTYSAISYVWGHTLLDSQILCNGIEIPICTSLAIALKHLGKSEHRKKFYWCDAICIGKSPQPL